MIVNRDQAIEAIIKNLGLEFWEKNNPSHPVNFRISSTNKTLHITRIEAPRRSRNPWFDLARMSSIISGLLSGAELPPLQVVLQNDRAYLYDGFHRFYVSLAFGIEVVPVQYLNVPIDEKNYSKEVAC